MNIHSFAENPFLSSFIGAIICGFSAFMILTYDSRSLPSPHRQQEMLDHGISTPPSNTAIVISAIIFGYLGSLIVLLFYSSFASSSTKSSSPLAANATRALGPNFTSSLGYEHLPMDRSPRAPF